MSKTRVMIAILFAATLMVAGCETAILPPMGDSVTLAREMQKLNPGPSNLDPVEGLNGQKVLNSMEIYKNSNAESLPQSEQGLLGDMKLE